MTKYFYAGLLFLLLGSCKSTLTKTAIPSGPGTIHLYALSTNDLTEDMSRISTQEDEVVLFSYLTREYKVIQKHQMPMYVFSKQDSIHSLSYSLSALQSNDRCSFFLVEVDNEVLPANTDSLFASWVTSPSFPENFNPLRADSLLGDDDLLGMKSYLIRDFPRTSPLVFTGRQLFDRFRYELFFSVE